MTSFLLPFLITTTMYLFCFKISYWGGFNLFYLLLKFFITHYLTSWKLYPIASFLNLKLKCAHAFYPDIARAIWQCLHTASSCIFGFLFHPLNAVLISVASAPSNVKIMNLKKKSLSANVDGSSPMPTILSTVMNRYCCCPLLWKQEHCALWNEYFLNSALLCTPSNTIVICISMLFP